MSASKTVEPQQQAQAPDFDLRQLERLGQEVVQAMQSLRELFETRARALEDCRVALEQHRNRLLEETQSVQEQEIQLCEQYEKREADLTARESRCTELEKRLKSELESRDAASKDLSKQRDALLALKQEIEQEKSAFIEREKALVDQEKVMLERRNEIEQRVQELASEKQRITAAARELEAQSAKMAAEKAQREAQAQQLAQHQEELKRVQAQLRKEQETVASHAQAIEARGAEFKAREAELVKIGQTIQQRAQELDQREKKILGLEQEFEKKMVELKTAQNNLTGLQRQLREELGKMAGTSSELLPDFSAPMPVAVPEDPARAAADKKARESIERFQKLCRDAKRRAVGA